MTEKTNQIALDNIIKVASLLEGMLEYVSSMRKKKKNINHARLSDTMHQLQGLLNIHVEPDIVHEINNQLCILFLYSNNITQNSKYEKYYDQLKKINIWVSLLASAMMREDKMINKVRKFAEIYNVSADISDNYPHVVLIVYSLLEYGNQIQRIEYNNDCVILHGNLHQPRLNSLMFYILSEYELDLRFERHSTTKVISTLYINFRNKNY